MIDRKFLYGLLVVVFILVSLKIWGPKAVDWSPTLDPESKIPYGTWILQQELKTIFTEILPAVSHTWYEMVNEDQIPASVLSISENFFVDSLDAISLLHYIDSGGFAFISASYYAGWLADSLKLTTDMGEITPLNLNLTDEGFDSTSLRFVNPHWQPDQQYSYRDSHWYAHFTSFDSLTTEIVAVDQLDQPVLLKIDLGNGALMLNSTPLAFSNYYLLKAPNHEFVSKALSLLPSAELQQNFYHQFGRRQQATTPMRFVVSQPALRWAYYLIIVSLLLFVLFEAKRKQRIMPVLSPLKNTTVDFVNTMGRLYYEQGNHRDLKDKMIRYFLEDLRSQYHIYSKERNAQFYQVLSKKSQVDTNTVKKLFEYIELLENQPSVSSNQLMTLNNYLNAFRKQAIYLN